MRIRFCKYCGGPIGECDCERIVAEEEAEFIEDYENDPEVQYGWRQQDLIDLWRFER